MEINDIPVAVLNAAFHVILEAFENLSRTVSRLIEVKIPDPMARPIAIPGDRVGSWCGNCEIGETEEALLELEQHFLAEAFAAVTVEDDSLINEG
ncbi:hypothetical protein BGX26_004681 [Mortierella sp. AD094]|nr:hypothetical protein BGX26_004681 [Mortierella sp. AD094]